MVSLTWYRNHRTCTRATAPSVLRSRTTKPSKCGRPAAKEPPSVARPSKIPTPPILLPARWHHWRAHPRGTAGRVGSAVCPNRWRWLRAPTTSTSKRNRPLALVSQRLINPSVMNSSQLLTIHYSHAPINNPNFIFNWGLLRTKPFSKLTAALFDQWDPTS